MAFLDDEVCCWPGIGSRPDLESVGVATVGTASGDAE